MDPLKMYFLLEKVDFHCYVRLPEGKFSLRLCWPVSANDTSKPPFSYLGVCMEHLPSRQRESILHNPDAACMEYLPTFGLNVWLEVNTPYMDPMGKGVVLPIIGDYPSISHQKFQSYHPCPLFFGAAKTIATSFHLKKPQQKHISAGYREVSLKKQNHMFNNSCLQI